jgi:hypothetical protein
MMQDDDILLEHSEHSGTLDQAHEITESDVEEAYQEEQDKRQEEQKHEQEQVTKLQLPQKLQKSQPQQYSNPSKYNASTPLVVGDFWWDKPEWIPGAPYLIREFTEETKISFFQRNRDLGPELFFFFCLLCVGAIIVRYNWSLIDEKEFLASMFFVSGLIPGIQLILFEVLPRKLFSFTGANRDGRNAMELDNFLSAALSILFLSVAVAVYPFPEEAQDGWAIVSGKTLFEAGLIYFVTRVLFFVPNPNDRVRQLQQEVSNLKRSMAMGLADGYFWNLVKEIAVDIRDANGPEQTLKLTYPRQGEMLKHINRFLIVVPRSLDLSNEDDPIKNLINKYKDLGHFQDCKIEKSPLRADSSRIKWVTDVIVGLNISNGSANPPYPYGILMDIPTTITALVMNLRADHASNRMNTVELEQMFQAEASSFAYRIAWQLKRQQLEEHVAVVEIENADDLLDKIRNVDEHLNNKRT